MLWLLLIGISLGLVIAGFGAFMLFKKLPFDKVTGAEVVSSECSDGKCLVELKYVDEEKKTYFKKARLLTPIEKGEEITIMYDSKNPNNVCPCNPPVRMIGIVTSVIGVFVVLVGFALWLFGGSKNVDVVTQSQQDNSTMYDEGKGTSSMIESSVDSTVSSDLEVSTKTTGVESKSSIKDKSATTLSTTSDETVPFLKA